jgi:prepilin-type N-terminal cleavage/methylation domain-containing protein/prepilin-type processing-associated H-X9-DG protein
MKSRFTLIELLVVIAIIGVLASILMPSLQKSREATKTIVCVNQMAQISKAEMMHIEDNNEYFTIAQNRGPGHVIFDEQLTDYLSIDLPDNIKTSVRNYTMSNHAEIIKDMQATFLCPIDTKLDVSSNFPGRGRRTYTMNGYGWNSGNLTINYGVSGKDCSVQLGNIVSASETIVFLEQQAPYNTIGGYNHCFAKDIGRWQKDNNFIDQMTFHNRSLNYNFAFADGSVRLMNINKAWNGGVNGFWNRRRQP